MTFPTYHVSIGPGGVSPNPQGSKSVQGSPSLWQQTCCFLQAILTLLGMRVERLVGK